MCGIAGLLDPGLRGEGAALERIATRMAGVLEHRGPDDAGSWCDPEAGLGFGHRRLSIIDLSAAGRQPMVSASRRFVLSFNGEIYDFATLRRELERCGARFRGSSDTEVALAAIETWGLERAVERFVGMFAFSVWDREVRRLHLVRDRLGIKPLYYGRAGSAFVFASELEGIRAHPGFEPRIDRDALAAFLRLSYVPTPHSIYRGVHKLPPASILTLDAAGDPDAARPRRYWSARDVAEEGAARPFDGSDDEAVDELERTLRDAVRIRMVADVPLGAFLSGGYDSSTVAALMQAESSRPVRTFSIGFHEAGFDEAGHAARVASHLGTEHTELYVTAERAREVVPRLPDLYDEPFADASQIPTALLCELTRRHVKVSLSGDGGDELFSGYDRYFWAPRIWKWLGWMPRPLRSAGGRILRGALAAGAPFRFGASRGPWGLTLRDATRLEKLSGMLEAAGPEGVYRGLVSHWPDPSSVALGATEARAAVTDPGAWPEPPSFAQWMMYLDLVSYLPDDILTKVDRASMGTSLEARVPLLDHRVVELAWRLPLHLKVRDGRRKWILRQVLYRHVPPDLVDRPKMGFGVPIGAWLRGPLRGWAEELLAERRLREEGYLDPVPIRRRWEDHVKGRRDWQYPLWDVLMFQAWLEAAGP